MAHVRDLITEFHGRMPSQRTCVCVCLCLKCLGTQFLKSRAQYSDKFVGIPQVGAEIPWSLSRCYAQTRRNSRMNNSTHYIAWFAPLYLGATCQLTIL